MKSAVKWAREIFESVLGYAPGKGYHDRTMVAKTAEIIRKARREVLEEVLTECKSYTDYCEPYVEEVEKFVKTLIEKEMKR